MNDNTAIILGIALAVILLLGGITSWEYHNRENTRMMIEAGYTWIEASQGGWKKDVK